MNQNCMSINFEKKYKRCHLNTDDSNSGTIIHEDGVVYSDIKYWPKVTYFSVSTVTPISLNTTVWIEIHRLFWINKALKK